MTFPLMSHQIVFKFLRNLVPGILGLPKFLRGAPLVWVVDASCMPVGSVDLLKVEVGFHAENSEVLALVGH